MDLRTIRTAATALHFEGRLAEAETLMRNVVSADPSDYEAATTLGMTLLARGCFAEGAKLYESRLSKAKAPALSAARWSGEPLDGKRVLIWPEQGLGDQIMCARFALALKQRACDVTLICYPALHRLFTNCLDLRVLPAAGTIDFPDPDVWIWTMSLMAALGERHVRSGPYLFAKPRQGGFRIGVASRGSATNQNDRERSIPSDLAGRLLDLPGAGSLLPEDTGASDMAETAEIIASLDLVITVDTSIAHLAGAMGKPVWILLPAHGTDWRWLRDRETSPWYPSAKLFRQRTPGDWQEVVERVRVQIGA